MNIVSAHRVMLIVLFCLSLFSGCAHRLAKAVIVIDSSDTVRAKAAEMLSDEIANRTGVRLEVTNSMPGPAGTAIVLGTVGSVGRALSLPEGLEVPSKAEGYAIWVDNKRVYLVGRDNRGALFAAGRLIRLLTMSKGKIGVSASLRLADAPEYPIRGHQLGYRGLNNTYDTWDLATYEQYVRDLIIFGTNAIELIPIFDPT
ncbi:MAG: glycoside hydrolase family 20 zincin-like fold domain-containing protein, partial [Planctomycetota bacterium]